MKTRIFAPVCLLLILGSLMFARFPFLPPKAAADTFSSVYLTPVQNCCISPTPPGPSTSFTVNVMMNLASTDLINGFDIRLNYTNFFSPGPPSHGVVKASTLDFSNSYLSNNFASSQIYTQASCIDDVTYGQSGICATDDVPGGQVHFAQTLLGTNMTGPVTGALLFSVTFTVNATGLSLIYFERAHLANPGGIPPNPHYIPVTSSAAVFGNDPNERHVAFFDYQSTKSPSVLAGIGAMFDASASFLASSSGKMSLTNPTYYWDFGDGNKTTSTNPILSHTFGRAGNYTVSLNVTDAFPGLGTFQRIVQVSPLLGTLQISVKNQNGEAITETVTVKLYNLTSPVPPLCSVCTKTVSAGGFAEFSGLDPGSYSMNFTGHGVISSGKITTVGVGWPNMETVYLQEILPPPTNFFPLWIFGAVISVGLGLGALALYRRSRSLKRMANTGQSARKAKKPSLQ